MMQINTTFQVATAGEALIDLIHNDAGLLLPCLGGAVYNLARALARQKVSTLYLNPLSQDRFGRQLAQALVDDGVHLGAPKAVHQVTSLAVVGVNSEGHPDYAFYREGVADRATTAAALTAACAQSSTLSLVCTGALALSPDDAQTYLPWLASQREAGRTVVIDANLRPSVMPDLSAYRQHVLAALQYADVIKASDEDLACLGLPGETPLAQATALLRGSQAACLALTQGRDGATLLTRAGQVFHAREKQPVVVVDTVGAGDCFLAGMIASLLDNGLASNWGDAPVEASLAKDLLLRAVSSASLCIMKRGCVPPTRDEVQARLSQNRCEFTEARNTLAGVRV